MRLSVCFAGLFPVFPAFLSLPAFSIPPLQNLHAYKKHGDGGLQTKGTNFYPLPLFISRLCT
jgi:hypothetical protein